MAYAIICTLNVQASQEQSFIVLFCLLNHLPQVDQMGSGTLVFGKTSLVIVLSLVNLIGIQIVKDNRF